jgi:meso-butanediol dehydrogenase/(S,S)-butanediol dehydrogenase/diacetyl reductase
MSTLAPPPVETTTRDLADKPVVLVTGGSSGIGQAVARRFAAGAFRIVSVARRKARLEQLANDMSGITEVEVVACDITTKNAADQCVATAIRAFGRLDCLVNNAGVGKWGRVGETDDETLDEVIETSLKAPFRFARAALSVMRPGSSIINVGSTFGILGGLKAGAYCAAKAGLIGLTQAIAADYGAKGIRANLVAPGVVKTKMTEGSWDAEWFRRTNQEMTPLDRDGTVDDVANLIFFLASPQGSYIQGQTIALDGGWTTTKFLSREALTCERAQGPRRESPDNRGRVPASSRNGQ